VRRLEADTHARVAYLSRLGEGMLPARVCVVLQNFFVHVLVRTH
jgi:hypothetical protein